jgi:hypothetical protein
MYHRTLLFATVSVAVHGVYIKQSSFADRLISLGNIT